MMRGEKTDLFTLFLLIPLIPLLMVVLLYMAVWICVLLMFCRQGGGELEAPLDLFRPQSAMILRSAVQNDLMLRNRQVSRVRAEPPWRHFLHSDNAALLSLPFTSSAGEQQRGVWTVSVPIYSGPQRCRLCPLAELDSVIRWRWSQLRLIVPFTVVMIQSCMANPSIFFNPKQTCELLKIANRK